MNRKMSGFVDPYSLGLIISLAAVIVIQFTQKELPDEIVASHQSVSQVNMTDLTRPQTVIAENKLQKSLN